MTMATRPHAELSEAVTPEQFGADLIAAQKKAAILKGVVDTQKLSIQIGPSEHLKVEAWQTIGRAYHYAGKTEVVDFLRGTEGQIVGVKAHADIVNIDTGIVVGGADSFCMADEEGKSEQSVAQLAGMAQTRAEARAFKQMLSWVVVLAGYSPTPAEEMGSGRVSAAPKDGRHACPKHPGKIWTRREKEGKTWYSHREPSEKSGYCNMADFKIEGPGDHDDPRLAQDTPAAASSAPPGPAGVVETAEAPQKASSADFEALVKGLTPLGGSMTNYRNNAVKLGYKTTAQREAIAGPDSQITDLDAAQYKLIEASPLRPKE